MSERLQLRIDVDLRGRHSRSASHLPRVAAGSDASGPRREPPCADRPTPPDPYDFLPQVPSFSVTSSDVTDGAVPMPQVSGVMGAGGEDRSPQLSWSGSPRAPRASRSPCTTRTRPTASGFWHWAVANIPASVTELPSGAGDRTARPAPRGRQLRNDGGFAGYVGAAPAVRARPAPLLRRRARGRHRGPDVTADTTPAVLGFNLFFHTLARATLVATYEQN